MTVPTQPVPIQRIEEELSLAYASVVIAKAGGVVVGEIRRDYGVDISVRRIKSRNGKPTDVGAVFDCQLKASINWSLESSNVVYDLEAEAYNKLAWRRSESSTPCILVVLCLPRDESEWVNLSEEELLLRKCCYWTYIDGAPVANKRSVRIRIARNQLFTPEEVGSLVARIEQESFAL